MCNKPRGNGDASIAAVSTAVCFGKQTVKEVMTNGKMGASHPSGHSVTALYQVKLHAAALGRLAPIFIRHEDPDTHEVTDVRVSLATADLSETFDEASSAFQWAASVAEFAEILRGSSGAEKGSFAAVKETLASLGPAARTQQGEALIGLVREAIRLKARKEG